MIFVRDIQQAVADHHRIPVETMWGRSNLRAHSWPRQEAMCLSRRLTDRSTVTIARCFKRDHSTVVNATQVVERRQSAKPSLRCVTKLLLREPWA